MSTRRTCEPGTDHRPKPIDTFLELAEEAASDHVVRRDLSPPCDPGDSRLRQPDSRRKIRLRRQCSPRRQAVDRGREHGRAALGCGHADVGRHRGRGVLPRGSWALAKGRVAGGAPTRGNARFHDLICLAAALRLPLASSFARGSPMPKRPSSLITRVSPGATSWSSSA